MLGREPNIDKLCVILIETWAVAIIETELKFLLL